MDREDTVSALIVPSSQNHILRPPAGQTMRTFARGGRCMTTATFLLLVLLVGASASFAQQATPILESMPLTVPVKNTLASLQENWLQWDSSFLRGDEEGARMATEDLLRVASELGMSRLPDLCFAILARASEAAAGGQTQRARWALEMAESLDPGRPETSMAVASVARRQGHYIEMTLEQMRGYLRLAGEPVLLRLSLENLLVWLLASVILCGVLFVSLQLAAYGSSLIEDLAELGCRVMPVPSAYLVALVVVILPILVPSAWIAIPFYWAVLLARYSWPRERFVLAGVLAVLVATPFLLEAQARRVRVEISGPLRAVRSLHQGRLYGALFKDIESLREKLGDQPAVLELVGDLQQHLGQAEYARLLYEDLLRSEAVNIGAHNNLGVYYLQRHEMAKAIEHFERAASFDPDRLEPPHNLYLLYRDYLAFEEAEGILAHIRSLAPDQVAAWVRDGGPDAPLLMREGSGRLPEIRAGLLAAEAASSDEGAMAARSSRISPLIIFAVLAIALFLLLLRYGSGRLFRVTGADGLQRVAPWIPGLSSLLAGHSVRAFAALFVPVSIILLPQMTDLGYRLPWGFDPGVSAAWLVCVLLLVLYVAARWLVKRTRSMNVV